MGHWHKKYVERNEIEELSNIKTVTKIKIAQNKLNRKNKYPTSN